MVGARAPLPYAAAAASFRLDNLPPPYQVCTELPSIFESYCKTKLKLNPSRMNWVLECETFDFESISLYYCFSLQASPSVHRHNYSEPPQHVELKLNVTDSQLVLVEEPSVWDTNAVILRVRDKTVQRLQGYQTRLATNINLFDAFQCNTAILLFPEYNSDHIPSSGRWEACLLFPQRTRSILVRIGLGGRNCTLYCGTRCAARDHWRCKGFACNNNY